MKKEQYLKLGILLIFPVLLITTFFHLFYINTDVLTSLNRNYFEQGFSTAYEKYEKSLAGDLVLLVSGADLATLTRQANELDILLDESSHFEKSKTSDFLALGKFYYRNRKAILTPYQQKSLENDIGLVKEDALKQIYSPFGSALSTLSVDPFVLVPGFFANFTKPVELTPHGRYFKTNSETMPSLIIRRKVGPGREGDALSFLDGLKSSNSEIQFSYSSLGFYGVKAKAQAISESNMFSLLTIVLILLVFYRYFRSLRHLFLSFSSIMFCTSIGLCVTGIIFGGIHLMSLLMGISILGIMADYFIHYFIKERDNSISNGVQAFNSIKKPLLWSFITSLVGFVIFSIAPLPLLQEFGVFAISSLLCAIFVVRYVLTGFYKTDSTGLKSTGYLSGLNEKVMTGLIAKRVKVWTLIPLFIGFMSLLIFKTTNNDIRSFSSPDVQLRLNEDKIKKGLQYKYGHEFFIVRGHSLQNLLENEEALKAQLKKGNVKASFLTHYIPSEKSQKKSIAVYNDSKKEMVTFLKQFKTKPMPNIKNKAFSYEDFTAEFPNFDILKQYIGNIEKSFYTIVPLYLEQDSAKKLLTYKKFETKDIVYMNKLRFINQDVTLFSSSITYGLLIFAFVFFIILGFKFGVTDAGAIIFPSIISIFTSITMIQIFGVGINIFHLLGGVLIFALGLDYSFFYYFNRKKSTLTMSSIELSTLTTISSFGVLALSSTHAVSSFGLMVFIGIVSCWFWAPFSYLGAKND